MPSRGIHHVDLAVANVERSLAFYLDLLGPLGWEESVRYPSYRGTEEVVYLKDAVTGSRDPGSDSSMLGIRRRMAACIATTGLESSTSPLRLTDGRRLTRRTHAASRAAPTFTSRRRRIATSLATTRSLPSMRMGFESKYSAGLAEMCPTLNGGTLPEPPLRG